MSTAELSPSSATKRQRVSSSSNSSSSSISSSASLPQQQAVDSNNNNFHHYQHNNNNSHHQKLQSNGVKAMPSPAATAAATPTSCIHIRNLSEAATEADVVHALEKFGKISFTLMMSKKRQALVEFADATSAIKCVNEARSSGILMAGSAVYINFHSSQKLPRPGDDDYNATIAAGVMNVASAKMQQQQQQPTENHILLFTVLNPLYPITVQVLHTICSPLGKVERMVIFRKNGVQAMVEFDCVESARKVLETLNGADIYSGCCTLKIEYAKPTKLNVTKNDQDSWDYTIDKNIRSSSDNHHQQQANQPEKKKAPLLEMPPIFTIVTPSPTVDLTSSAAAAAVSSDPYASYMAHYQAAAVYHAAAVAAAKPTPSLIVDHHHHHTRSTPPSTLAYPPPLSSRVTPGSTTAGGGSTDVLSAAAVVAAAAAAAEEPPYARVIAQVAAEMQSHQSGQVVLMVYNLCMDKFNCDRLFNLLCLYANVDRIKFLSTKEGSAMVQISSPDYLFTVLNHLNNTYAFGKKLQISVSKQNVLNPVPKPSSLSDGTPSFKEYIGSRNNRYSTLESAQKNKPLSPSNVLHWFNAPPDIAEHEIADAFVRAGAKAPSKIKVFPKRSEKSSTGLAEFNNIADCVDALVLTNHAEINHPSSKFPYILKLCFSSTPIIDRPPYQNNNSTSGQLTNLV